MTILVQQKGWIISREDYNFRQAWDIFVLTLAMWEAVPLFFLIVGFPLITSLAWYWIFAIYFTPVVIALCCAILHPRALHYVHNITVVGTDQFVDNVTRIMQELKEQTPEHHKVALRYLSVTLKWTDKNSLYHHGDLVDALSDGRFAIDGSERGYNDFRWVFLHELGHRLKGNVYAYFAKDFKKRDLSEEAANKYANDVLAELEDITYKRYRQEVHPDSSFRFDDWRKEKLREAGARTV